MRSGLIFLLLTVAVARSEEPAVVLGRDIAKQQARYAKIAPMIGRILVVDAKYFGGLAVSLAIEREYEAVRELPEAVRAEFFFVIATKIRLDASYLTQFLEMVSRDCPAAFERRLVTFLDVFGQAAAHEEVRRATTYLRLIRERARR